MMTYLFLLLNFVFADVEFLPIRQDRTMPAHCVNLTAEDFSEPSKRVIYGIEGYKNKGFSHEIPLERQEARDLWHAMNGDRTSLDVVASSEELSKFKETLETAGVQMGFDYGKEGDVLEALALLDLEKEYPSKDYFHTGGYEYSNGRGPVVGELDVLVGRRSDCNIIVVGEAKLGHKMLNKAHSQLNRFENFYRVNAP
jgi:hypothetical protein